MIIEDNSKDKNEANYRFVCCQGRNDASHMEAIHIIQYYIQDSEKKIHLTY